MLTLRELLIVFSYRFISRRFYTYLLIIRVRDSYHFIHLLSNKCTYSEPFSKLQFATFIEVASAQSDCRYSINEGTRHGGEVEIKLRSASKKLAETET